MEEVVIIDHGANFLNSEEDGDILKLVNNSQPRAAPNLASLGDALDRSFDWEYFQPIFVFPPPAFMPMACWKVSQPLTVQWFF